MIKIITLCLTFFIFNVWFWSSMNNIDFNKDMILKVKEKIEQQKQTNTNLKLYAWWDIMISRSIWSSNRNNWYKWFFLDNEYNPLKEDCTDDCIAFLNLESLFNSKYNDYDWWWFSFKSSPQNIWILNNLKGNNKMILSLANNHTSNVWYNWVIETMNLLKENWIEYVWIWKTPEESHQTKIIEKNWIKLCFQAYSYDWWYKGWFAWNSIPSNWKVTNVILNDISNMNIQKCDFKIASVHWWREYRYEPTEVQTKLWKDLIDNWFDLILWWHSHIPWKIEKYNDKYIIYSFWNFIFDQWWWVWNNIPSQYDTIFDKTLNMTTTPTYIWLNILFNFKKNNWKSEIEILKTKTIRINAGAKVLNNDKKNYWIVSKNDSETHKNILEKIMNTY